MKADLYPNENSQIRCYILTYLTENPGAGDTYEGIQWWLLDRWIKHQSPNVKEVLEQLVEDGLVVRYRAGDGRIHYLVNQRKQAEIELLLKKTYG